MGRNAGAADAAQSRCYSPRTPGVAAAAASASQQSAGLASVSDMSFPSVPDSSKKTGADRREAVRRHLRSPALVLLPGQPGRVGRTVDVSETGLCLMLPDGIAGGTECMVGFELPDKAGARKRYQSRVRVVHSVLSTQGDGFKIGMQFMQLPDDTRRALETFIRE